MDMVMLAMRPVSDFFGEMAFSAVWTSSTVIITAASLDKAAQREQLTLEETEILDTEVAKCCIFCLVRFYMQYSDDRIHVWRLRVEHML